MTKRRRLAPEERRQELLDVGARLFATKPYDAVLMEEVAERAGVSRALLYRHFSSKRDLLAGVYQQAADRLLARTVLDPGAPIFDQVARGLDEHIDYFAANSNTVLAANRSLVGDPVIQNIITDELGALREHMLEVIGVRGARREVVSAVLMSWLLFVRALCVEWLANETFDRTQLRDSCVEALRGALTPVWEVEG